MEKEEAQAIVDKHTSEELKEELQRFNREALKKGLINKGRFALSYIGIRDDENIKVFFKELLMDGVIVCNG